MEVIKNVNLSRKEGLIIRRALHVYHKHFVDIMARYNMAAISPDPDELIDKLGSRQLDVKMLSGRMARAFPSSTKE